MLRARMKVWVTGAGGFLGSHVVAELRRRGGYEIIAPRSTACDLCTPSSVAAVFTAARPDAVIHCAAAVGGIGANAREPYRFFFDNASMALNLVDGARRAGCRRFVAVGTTCAYPREAPLPLNERDFWNGAPDAANAPYGHAKRLLYAHLEASRRQYGTNMLMVIPANLYGPGDHFETETSHVIPGMIARFAAAVEAQTDAVSLWGDGTPTRDFLHVRDAARGLVDAFEKDGLEGLMNLGAERETSMAELAAMVGAAAGYRGAIVWDPSRPNGQPRRWLDVSRARAEIGFAPETRLEDGIRETLDWYRQQRRRAA